MSKESNSNNETKLDKELDLGKDFPPSTYEAWKTTAEESLKGATLEKKLVTQTYEGIDLQPIYMAKDIENLPHPDQTPGFNNFARGSQASGYLGNPMEICQEIPSASVKQFNEALQFDLKRGQNAVNLILDKASMMGMDSDSAPVGDVGNGGPAISTLEDFSNALEGVDIERYPIHINPGYSALASVTFLKAFTEKQGKKISGIKGSVDADPLGFLATHGKLPVSMETAFEHMTRVTLWAYDHAPHLKTIGVSGLPYHNAGADSARELAYTLATAVEYIDRAMGQNASIDAIAGNMRFTFGIGPFYFMEVAKIRAARIMWAKIVQSYGGAESSQKMTIHARTSTYNQTMYDPYANMLRATTETFSAFVAGVDSLHTHSFNEVFGIGDEFSRRTARNTQIVLSEECSLERSIDPVGGSYFVEKLTHQIAEKAWKLFQEIEAKGGMLKALTEGFPQSEVESVDKKRKSDIAKRKSNIIGTNFSANVKEKKLETTFPDYKAIRNERVAYLDTYRKSPDSRPKGVMDDKLLRLKNAFISGSGDVVVISTEAVLCGATLGEIAFASSAGKSIEIKPIVPGRASEMFEELRDAVGAYKTKTGSAPKLFLATMGPLSQFKARADFSQSFFEVGGFDVIYPQGFDTTEAAVEAAVESGAMAVAICSTDDTYPQLVPPITRGLKEKKPGIVVALAGYPKDQIESHKQAGIDEFIYLGVDAYLALSGILKKLGVLS
jgi:methylmalonyl-CoA mutase